MPKQITYQDFRKVEDTFWNDPYNSVLQRNNYDAKTKFNRPKPDNSGIEYTIKHQSSYYYI